MRQRKPMLNADTVNAVREWKQRGIPQKEIAQKLGISAASVSRIINGSRHAQKAMPHGA